MNNNHQKTIFTTIFIAFAIIIIASGCSSRKLVAPPDHKGSGVSWTSFRGNDAGASGVAGETVDAPLAVKWTFKAGEIKDADKGDESGASAGAVSRARAFRSSPVSSAGVVVVGSMDGNVYGVDADSGKELWRFNTGDAVIASPLIFESRVYVGSMNGRFYCLDLKTGEKTLEYSVSRGIKGGAATDGTNVYFGALDKRFYALDLKTFESAWQKDDQEKTGNEKEADAPPALPDASKLPAASENTHYFETSDWIESTPTVIRDVAYFGSNDGFLYAVYAETGKLKWRYETADCVYSTPAIVNGVIYFTSWDGNVYALYESSGSLKWKTKIDDQVSASPAVAGGRIVVGGALGGDLVGLDAKNGEIIWRVPTMGGFDAGPVFSGGVVYVGSYDNFLYAIDPADGSVAWKMLMKHVMRGSVAVANNTIYAGVGNGKLYALVTAQ